MEEYDDLCQKDKKDICISNILNLQTMISPFNYDTAVVQGLYIRDWITSKKLMKDIFIEKLGFNFEYIEVVLTDYDEDSWQKLTNLSASEQETVNKEISDQMQIDIFNIVQPGKLYFIRIEIPGHFILNFVDTRGHFTVLIYDPTMPDKDEQQAGKPYWYVSVIRNVYHNKHYFEDDLPDNILWQGELPLCYMYVIHLFLYKFLTMQSDVILDKYNDQCDDVYIMKFTRDILKLCYEYGMVKASDYYLLTNNSYKIQEIIKKEPSVVFYHIIGKVSSVAMIKTILNHIGFFSPAFIFEEYKWVNDYIDKTLAHLDFQIRDGLKTEVGTEVKIARFRVLLNIIIYKGIIGIEQDITKSMQKLSDDLAKEKLSVNDLLKNWYYQDDLILFRLYGEKNNVDLYLLDNKEVIDREIKDKDGNTILLKAISDKSGFYDNNTKTGLILTSNSNAQNNEGDTALMIASRNNDIDTVMLLFTRSPMDVDVNIKNKAGETALDIAKKLNHPQIVDILSSKKITHSGGYGGKFKRYRLKNTR